MRAIVIIVSKNLVTYFPFVKTRKESIFQQVGGLIAKNVSVFVSSGLRSTSKARGIQYTFLKKFPYLLLMFIL